MGNVEEEVVSSSSLSDPVDEEEEDEELPAAIVPPPIAALPEEEDEEPEARAEDEELEIGFRVRLMDDPDAEALGRGFRCRTIRNHTLAFCCLVPCLTNQLLNSRHPSTDQS